MSIVIPLFLTGNMVNGVKALFIVMISIYSLMTVFNIFTMVIIYQVGKYFEQEMEPPSTYPCGCPKNKNYRTSQTSPFQGLSFPASQTETSSNQISHPQPSTLEASPSSLFVVE